MSVLLPRGRRCRSTGSCRRERPPQARAARSRLLRSSRLPARSAASGRGPAARAEARARPALLGREIRVAGRERKPVLLADGRKDADLEIEIEVAHHPPDDGDLLRVLLAEVGAARPDDVEELEAHGGDAAEVAGTGAPSSGFEAPPPPPRSGTPAGRARPATARTGSRLLSASACGASCARRAGSGEILPRAELRRVDEEAHHHEVVLGARGADERQCPSWKAPIVGTRPGRSSPSSARSSAIVRTVFIGQHCLGRLGELAVQPPELRRALVDRS